MDRTRLSRFLDQPLAELDIEDPVLVSSADSVRKAVELMREGQRSCVLLAEDDRVTGIFTERDLLTKCMTDGYDWDQSIANAVTPAPETIPINGNVADAIVALKQHHYRTLPVAEGSRVVGIVRLGDLLTHVAEAFPEDILNLPPRPHQVMEKQEGG